MPKSVPLPSIVDHFLADHRRLDDLFERLLAAFEANDREDIGRLWTELDAGLLAHLEAEESLLIPRFAELHPTEARALLEDHGQFRKSLTELGEGIDLHVVRSDMARVFVARLRAHALREDRLPYRWGDEYLPEPERTSLVRAIETKIRTAMEAGRRVVQ